MYVAVITYSGSFLQLRDDDIRSNDVKRPRRPQPPWRAVRQRGEPLLGAGDDAGTGGRGSGRDIAALANGSTGMMRTTDGLQYQICGIADVNGDGVPDRIDGLRAFLGTGIGFSPVYLSLPVGGRASQESDHDRTCGPTWRRALRRQQVGGRRDLTGDGIPDAIHTWQSGIPGLSQDGTSGSALGQALLHPSPSRWSRGPSTSHTRPNLRGPDVDHRRRTLRPRRRRHARSGARQLQALECTNSRGAQCGRLAPSPKPGAWCRWTTATARRTTIDYRSAKEAGGAQVPFPEVVATAVETKGDTLELGGSLSATRYAYKGGGLMFDSARDAFTFPGLLAHSRAHSFGGCERPGDGGGYHRRHRKAQSPSRRR